MIKILIYHPRQMGDVIMGQHCARLLKKKHGDCHITFVTNESLMQLVAPCPWIDSVLPQIPIDVLNFYSKEELNGKPQWKIYDYADLASFRFLSESGEFDLSYFPKWARVNPGDNREWKVPYIWTSFARSCDLQEFEDDTEYEIPLKVTETPNPTGRKQVLIHEDIIGHDFSVEVQKGLQDKNIDCFIIDTKSRSYVQNLAHIKLSDLVITRYGGVAVMAASQRTPSLVIPKAEPPGYGHPIYSHPNDGHFSLVPKINCGSEYLAEWQPCMLKSGNFDWDEKGCPVGYSSPKGTKIYKESEQFHCWRSIKPQEVIDKAMDMLHE